MDQVKYVEDSLLTDHISSNCFLKAVRNFTWSILEYILPNIAFIFGDL